jgi:hypothetical protein
VTCFRVLCRYSFGIAGGNHDRPYVSRHSGAEQNPRPLEYGAGLFVICWIPIETLRQVTGEGAG